MTDEDPTASPEERLRRFGQADHVRMYGSDFEDRLRSAGLQPRRIMPEGVIGEAAIDALRITPRTPIWLVFGVESRYRDLPENRLVSKLRRRVDRYLRRSDWQPRWSWKRK